MKNRGNDRRNLQNDTHFYFLGLNSSADIMSQLKNGIATLAVARKNIDIDEIK